ncbi:MAG: TonB-dependent receptor plug domain-containing protein, partial [Rickettsiales bacterium]
AKFSYRPSERSTLWGSVARAVRTPSRTEDTISFILLEQPTVPPTVIVGQGNPDIESEELIAYELGYRFSPQEGLVFDIAGYYNDYDNLVTLMPGTPFFNGSAVIVPTPVMNISDAEIYGVELSGSWQVTPSWKLAGYYTFSELTVNTPNIGPAFSAYQDLSLLNDYESLWPEQTFSIRSYYNVTDNVELDAALYYMPSLGTVTNLDGTPRNVDAYLRGDVRLGWRPWEGLEVSLAGLNLIEGEHAEFTDSRFNRATLIGRSYYGKVTWHF